MNPTPAGITGSNNVCTGVTSPLADATSGGTWSSSNSALATINSTSGAVTGVAAGNPTITYTLPAGCFVVYAITVNTSPVAISGSPVVCGGLTTTLSDGTSGGTWSSSSTTIATVGSTTGVVTGGAVAVTSNATITYTLPTGCVSTVTATVNPTPGPIAGANNVCVGAIASVTDGIAGGTWSSSNTALATVGTSGSVTGVSAGVPTLTYTLPAGCFVTAPITVNPSPAAITGANNVCTGATVALGNTVTGGIWSSSSPSIATVGSSTGIVTGVAATTSTVTITYTLNPGSCVATYPMTVNPLPANITGVTNVCVGSVTSLSDGTTGGTWSSSNTSLATVGATGSVTGVSAGIPTISYILATGCSATIPVTVNPLPMAITGTLSVCTGNTSNLGDATGGGTWTSSNTSVATITAGGVVTGVAPGTSVITYTLSTEFGNTVVTVTVNQTPLAITGGNNVCVGVRLLLCQTLRGGRPHGAAATQTLATVGSTGGVVGVATGFPIISYTSPAGCFVTYPITVNPTPAAITGTATACTGTTSTLSDATTVVVFGAAATTSQATVGSSSGIVSAVAPGIPVSTYTLPAGCTATVGFTVNLTPGPITGVTNTCIGSTSVLSDGSAGGFWSSSNTALATVGTGGGVTGVAAGTLAITYTLPAGSCFATTSFTVNPLPTPITGVAAVCVGSTTTLASTPSGGTWSSSNSAIASAVSASNIIAGISAGTATITYTIPTSCITTTIVTVNPLPTLFTVAGGGGYCLGSTAPNVTLSNSQLGANYQLKLAGVNVGSVLSGTGTSLNFGPQSTPGTYTVVATNTTTGCVSTMSGSATVAAFTLPNQYNVTGGGAYCVGGSGVPIGINGSDTSVQYKLYNGSAFVGATVSGTGAAISFGSITTAGGYQVVASNSVTGCTDTMLGTAIVSTVALPTAFTVTGGGGYCTGGTGMHIGVSGSQTGVNYNLFNGSSLVSTLPGSGSSIDFGLITAAGTYTVNAVTATSAACTTNMIGSATITINPLPTNTFSVTTPSGSSYCAGGAGVLIGLSGSQAPSGGASISYQVLYGAAPVGLPQIGTGTSLNFGVFGGASLPVYTIQASNTVTGCTSTMTGSASVTVNPLPASFSVSGGGGYCSGGAGVPILLSGSATGVNYTLVKPGGSTQTIGGTGTSLTYTGETLAGSYTIIATNTTTTCSVNMTGAAIVTINSAPNQYSVTGGGSYCSGGTGLHVGLSASDPGVGYQLFNGSSAIGAALVGTGSALDFGLLTVAGTYTVTATNITTGCTAGMIGSAVISITAPPAAFAVTGGGSYCVGGTGVVVGLFNSVTGVTYQLLNGGSPVGIPMAGTGSGISFGLQTAPGIYTVLATTVASGCTNTMTGSVAVSTISVPTVFTVSGGGAYCAGGAGVHIGLTGSTSGISYKLYQGGSVLTATLTGTGLPLDFGAVTNGGIYTVVAQNTSTGCTSNMSGSATITVNPLPSPFTVMGGGSYCVGGSGVHVTLSGSSSSIITYQLYDSIVPVSAPIAGTGSPIDFGLQTLAGNYTVVATNVVTGCTVTMPGSVNVSINPLPNVYTITGGGSYCPGGSGVLVGLTPSDAGVNYQLMVGGSPAGAPVAGTGGSISFGLQTTVGTYTVVATSATTGCTNTMAGSVTVNTYALPTAYTVTGGGSYCSGGAGLHVGLSNSTTGVNYQLYLGISPVGGPVAGFTGVGVDFGLQTAAGTYTVMATSTVTGCSKTMTGSVTINTTPLPNVYSVTGGGSYCSGGVGVHIGMGATDTGINYQLMRGISLVGAPVAGTGTTIDFGLYTTAGIYTVVATNATTGCVRNMAGSATISINPLPLPYIVAGGGAYCAGGTGVDVNMGGSDLGINYQLYNGLSAVGAVVAGTTFPIDFGLQTAAGTYKVVATNPTNGCSSNMLDSAVVKINAVPVVYTVSGTASYCPYVTTGINVDLSGSDTGVSYQLYNGATGSGSPIVGTGGVLDFSFTSVIPGTYTVKATNMSTGCVSTMSGSAIISAYVLPTAYDVTGGGSYCSGSAGVTVGLSSSATGFHYQLYRSGTIAMGASMAGNGLDLNFGDQTVAGTYTVIATNDTTGCTKTMTGSAVVSISALPTLYTLSSSSASYCFGSTGVSMTLSGSQVGMNYQLYNGSTAIGLPMAGTGASLGFGTQPTGTYAVVATNTTTGCADTISGVLNITINPLPTVHTVTGGGGYCAGGTGVHVYLDGS